MSFIESRPSTAGKELPYVRGKCDEDHPSTNFKNEERIVQITDARSSKEKFTLDQYGFAWKHDTTLSAEVLEAIRSKDRDANRVAHTYYPLVERLLLNVTGASRIIIFDHTYRKRNPELDMKENPNGREQPATVVHCDQSALGARRRVERHAGKDSDRLLTGRCQLINVWRPISGIVEDWPLATMDYQTMSPTEIHPTNIYRDRHRFVGQTVSISYAPTQKWYYLKEQTPDEVTLIKIWDSKDSVAKMCAHCSFQHPGSYKAKVPRESIEVRCLVFYEDERV
ncbi:methyltransferase [Lentithecium fluviatile CBS 122367]|uniref:Methyltransferase n=1 Tax=Lentithecium fluviatile CBS 122367 TaxID=1168545 RepID=A0A6G1JJC5_9PLEO|nr:methyltransferase [Lentithecium fluviatile CBS 122367]